MFPIWTELQAGNLTTWLIQAAAIPVTIFYANFFEWMTHKYLLHGLGKNPKSFWSFHWIDHHRSARRNEFLDEDYLGSVLKWNAQGKEIIALIGGAVLHLPLLIYFPLAFVTLIYCGLRYYFAHRKSHLDSDWAKKNLAWHYDHHMGANQNLNWCVTRPWFDWILGTRKTYFSFSEESTKRRLFFNG